MSAIVFGASSLLAFGGAELAVRFKNSSMRNYDIEMWRYAKELKAPTPVLGHDHVPNSEALLQSVTIRINDWKLRGGPVWPSDDGHRRILVLGSSITLGWGVPEEDTMTTRLQRMFEQDGQRVEILNGGIGNYNAERSIERFFRELEGLHPTDIVMHYFLRDAEELEAGGGNFLLRHSELAVTGWILGNRLIGQSGEQSLVDHYNKVYREDQPGYIAMLEALRRLSNYARDHHIRIYLAMTPDVHDLASYRFGFIHERMRKIAEADGYRYVDLLPALGALPPDKVWAMPGDPHPNSLGHRLMAEALYPVLKNTP